MKTRVVTFGSTAVAATVMLMVAACGNAANTGDVGDNNGGSGGDSSSEGGQGGNAGSTGGSSAGMGGNQNSAGHAGGNGGQAGASSGGHAGSAGGTTGATGGAAGSATGGMAGAAAGGATGGGAGGGMTGGSTGSYKIVVVGDSIAQGSSGTPGYQIGSNQVPPEISFRYDLWKQLLDAHVTFEFVGSLTKGFLSDNPAWATDYMGQKFQPHHEAIWGIAAKDQVNGDPSNDDPGGNGPLPPLEDRLKQYDVDIAIVQLGGNDWQDPVTHQKQSAQDKANDIGNIVDILRAKNPKVISLITGGHQVADTFRTLLQQLATQKNTAESPAVYVDVASNIDTTPGKDTYDYAHTTPSGDLKWATGIFNAMKPYLK